MFYLRNKNFWVSGLFFFFFFFIMGAYFPFFPIWLHDINHISKSDTGIVFAGISLFSLIFQPIFGYIADKLKQRKHLIWTVIFALLFFAPFFIYVLAPLLKTNIYAGAVVAGIYLGFVFGGGSPTIEAYIEKISRGNQFEYGRARLFGCIGWAVCASVTGILFTINNEFVFWLGSAFAVILAVLLFIAKPQVQTTQPAGAQTNDSIKAFSIKTALELLKERKLWFFILYIVGVACIYDVFDQQFANFFTSFFPTPQAGTRMFGYITTGGEVLNATIMFFAPAIVNRIGGKNALLIAGSIMSIRITGSAFAGSATAVVLLKMLHMFEVPFLIVGTFKYITTVFDVRFSATIYVVGFCFIKQLATMFMSVFAGNMYDKIGFKGAYLILGSIAFAFTVISVFTLSGREPLPARR